MAGGWHPWRHGKQRCAISFGEGPSRSAAARGSGRARGTFAGRSRPAVRSGARHGEPLDGVVATARGQGVSGPPPRTPSAAASDGRAGSHGGAVDRQPLLRSVAVAVCAVDAGSGATVVGPAVRGAGFGLDGGPLPARLGSDPAETGAAVLRTRPGGGPAVARGGISGDAGPSAAGEGADSLVGREGLRSDHPAGRSWGRRGQTPVVPGTGQRFGCNRISAIPNRGRLAFLVFRQRFTARVFLEFLRRLRRLTKRKLYLIADRHPVHRAARGKHWLAKHARQVRLFWLPSYSPELNPDELLNQDVKTNAVGRMRPRDEHELIGNVRSYLRITPGHPHLVRRYFRERPVPYAAL